MGIFGPAGVWDADATYHLREVVTHDGKWREDMGRGKGSGGVLKISVVTPAASSGCLLTLLTLGLVGRGRRR